MVCVAATPVEVLNEIAWSDLGLLAVDTFRDDMVSILCDKATACADGTKVH